MVLVDGAAVVLLWMVVLLGRLAMLMLSLVLVGNEYS